MFWRKLTTILVLALYGVPAAIGPYWHNHDCGQHNCNQHDCCHAADAHLCHVDLRGDDDSRVADGDGCCASNAAADCCSSTRPHHHGSHASPATAGISNSATACFASARSGGAIDDCAICRFYACTPCILSSLSVVHSAAIAEPVAVATHMRPRWHLPLHLARGPPMQVASFQ